MLAFCMNLKPITCGRNQGILIVGILDRLPFMSLNTLNPIPRAKFSRLSPFRNIVLWGFLLRTNYFTFITLRLKRVESYYFFFWCFPAICYIALFSMIKFSLLYLCSPWLYWIFLSGLTYNIINHFFLAPCYWFPIYIWLKATNSSHGTSSKLDFLEISSAQLISKLLFISVWDKVYQHE